MSKIFISHSSANNAAALAVAQWLEENGWGEYFLDITPAQGLAPGERWQAALKAAADRCEVVLFLISPAWRDSKWCVTEFQLAKLLGKKIFGVLIETTPLDSLQKEMTAEWQLCDLVAGAERRTYRVHDDPIVPETDISFAEAGLTRLRIGLQKSGLDPSTFTWPPDHEKDRAPYRGLKPLEAEDAAIFFGREAAIIRGLDTIRMLRERGVEQMFVILGASGAGKSSFLRAGLWPRLKRDDRYFVPLPVIRPERAAMTGSNGLMASLEGALREYKIQKTRVEIRKLVSDPALFWRVLEELQACAHARVGTEAASPILVIPIDQGEELFTTEGRAEAEDVLSLLGTSHQRTITLVAIRSDSYERLQTEPRLQCIKQALFDLKPMSREEFKAVIEGPARRATESGRKLAIQPALTEQLLKDAEGADALPLLAFTLERVFIEYGGDGDLRLDEYQALGGVKGSIEAAVTAAFAEPERTPAVPTDKAERERLLRQAFIPWLAAVDPETEERKRRVARWEELPVDAHSLLERLIAARLLVRDRRPEDGGKNEVVVLEVAHESLLRQWATLTSWLVEDAVELKTAEAIKRAAAEWDKNGRAGAWLIHTGERLDAAEVLQQRPDFYQLLGEQGHDYLIACRAKEETARAEREAQVKRIAEEQERVAVEQRKTARLQRWSTRLLVVIAVVILGAGSWIVVQSREVGRQTSLVLATAARDASSAGLYERALRFAILGSRRSSLSSAVAEAEPQLARAAHFSSMGARLAGHKDAVSSAAFSPDGQRVVTASDDKTARVWDATTGREVAKLTGHEDFVSSAAFSPDGRRVVTASHDRTARVWRADGTGSPVVLRGHQDPVWSAVFSPDGQRVVTASNDRTARVWDATTGKEVAKLTGHEATVFSAAFSPDGHRVVMASLDTTARVWDATTGTVLAVLMGHEDAVSSAAFSPDGRRVVTASDDKTARVWDVHWLTQYKVEDLIAAVCREKLVGATTLTERDVTVAPILSGRKGEDVCAPSSLISRIVSAVRTTMRASKQTGPD